MSHSQEQHALKITARFTELLGEELTAQLGSEHLAELALLIESAIDASVIEAEESLLTKLQDVINGTRREEAGLA